MSKASDLLNIVEVASDILYHVTSLWHLLPILQSDKFKLSTTIGTASDDTFRPKNKWFYLSTSRSKHGAYAYYVGHGSTMLVLDGQKFNQRYKAGPVDYWGRDFRSVKTEKPSGSNEMEDRIWSEHQFIPDASSYILEIHVNTQNDKHPLDDEWKETLRQCWLLAKKHKIPFYVYDGTVEQNWNTFPHSYDHSKEKNYKNLDKRKALSMGQVDLVTKHPKERWSGYPKPGRFDGWLELFHKQSEKDLSKNAKYLLQHYIQYNGTDAINQFANDLHGYKNDPQVENVVKVFRQNGFTTPKQFIDALRAKWNKNESIAAKLLTQLQDTDEDVGSVAACGPMPTVNRGLASEPWTPENPKKKKKKKK